MISNYCRCIYISFFSANVRFASVFRVKNHVFVSFYIYQDLRRNASKSRWQVWSTLIIYTCTFISHYSCLSLFSPTKETNQYKFISNASKYINIHHFSLFVTNVSHLNRRGLSHNVSKLIVPNILCRIMLWINKLVKIINHNVKTSRIPAS